MRPDDFERRLQRVPLRRIPAEWRGRVFGAIETSAPSRLSWFCVIFWPNPQAWAGLAVVWILIAVLNFAAQNPSDASSRRAVTLSPQLIRVLADHQKMLVELVDLREPSDIDRRRSVGPRPHSELRREVSAV